MKARASERGRVADVMRIRGGDEDIKLAARREVDACLCTLDDAERVRPPLPKRHQKRGGGVAPTGSAQPPAPRFQRTQPVGAT